MPFCDVEYFRNGRIELLLSVGMQWVDSGSAIGHRGLVHNECAAIKPLVYGRIAQLAISDTIGPIVLSVVQRSSVTGDQVKTGSAADMQQAGVLPATDNRIQEAVGVAEKTASVTHWNFQSKLRIEDVPNVLLRGAVVLIDVGLIEVVAVGEGAAMRIARVDGHGSGDDRGEPRGQRVVAAAGDRLRDGNITQLWI